MVDPGESNGSPGEILTLLLVAIYPRLLPLFLQVQMHARKTLISAASEFSVAVWTPSSTYPASYKCFPFMTSAVPSLDLHIAHEPLQLQREMAWFHQIVIGLIVCAQLRKGIPYRD